MDILRGIAFLYVVILATAWLAHYANAPLLPVFVASFLIVYRLPDWGLGPSR
jgi:hypothetical protein